MRASFDGDWQGTTTWYGRNGDGMNMKQGTVNPEASRSTEASIRMPAASTPSSLLTRIRIFDLTA